MSWGDATQREYERLENDFFGRDETIDFQTCDHCGQEVEEWEVINGDVTCNECKIYNKEHE